MVLKIDKRYFENLSNGEHTLKVNFKDGFAVGTFEVRDKVTFSILGVPCEATVGMSWAEWLESQYTRSGNDVILRGNDRYDTHVYINWNNQNPSFNIGYTDFSYGNYLYNSSNEEQHIDSIIIAGEKYGRESGGPDDGNAPV